MCAKCHEVTNIECSILLFALSLSLFHSLHTGVISVIPRLRSREGVPEDAFLEPSPDPTDGASYRSPRFITSHTPSVLALHGAKPNIVNNSTSDDGDWDVDDPRVVDDDGREGEIDGNAKAPTKQQQHLEKRTRSL